MKSTRTRNKGVPALFYAIFAGFVVGQSALAQVYEKVFDFAQAREVDSVNKGSFTFSVWSSAELRMIDGTAGASGVMGNLFWKEREQPGAPSAYPSMANRASAAEPSEENEAAGQGGSWRPHVRRNIDSPPP